jgi:molybdopterin converting factor small subunit
MEITVNFEGFLAETTGIRTESISESGSMEQIIKRLKKKHPSLEKLSFIVSVNGKISHGDQKINGGDLLTLIPPAPGG